MAQGGQFRLVLQSSKSDNMLNDSERFGKVISSIKARNNDTWTRDIADIEDLFTVFVSGTYKPYMAVGFEYSKTESQEGICGFGQTVRFKVNNFGDLLNDMVLHIKLTGLTATNVADKVRYYAFPGHKLIKRAEFFINNNPLLKYTTDYTNAYYNIHVPDDKRDAWKKCVGQEIPTTGYITPNPTSDEYKIGQMVFEGAQTFKRTQSSLDMWIPMLFPFREVRNALPILTLPYGQTYVEIEFANANEIISYADYGGGGAYSNPSFEVAEMYCNEIYIPNVMHELFKKPGMVLVRKQLYQKMITETSSMSVLLNDVHFPTESLYVAFSPTANDTKSQSWYKNKIITSVVKTTPIVNPALNVLAGSMVYDRETDVVTKIGLKTNGDIKIYDKQTPEFYENYIPHRFLSTSPSGWYSFIFNLYPGQYDPSGHINFSIAREIRLEYDSTAISHSNPTYCTVIANVLAFIILKDSSAVLRYCT